jgi:hypothetical protein
MNSGDVLQGETSRFAQLEALLIDSLGVDDHRDTAELPSYSMVRWVAIFDVFCRISSEVLRLGGEDRER